MGKRKYSKASYRRQLIDSAINSASARIEQEQKAAAEAAKAQIPDYAKGMTEERLNSIIDSYYSKQNEIPSLEQNTTPTTPTTPTPSIAEELERMKKVKADTTTPRTEGEQKAIDTYYNGLMEASGKTPKQNTPKVDYKAEIDRMNALKADTTAQRTEGENKAIDEYLKGLTEAQAYVDSQRKATQAKATSTSKKATQTKVEKQPLVTVRNNEDGTRNYTKTMSANEQRDYERALEAQARAVGREAKKNATPKERALSANEQRDYERALEAQAQAKEREKVTTTTVNQPMPTRANEKRGDEIITGQVVKNNVPEAIPTANGVPKKATNPDVNELVPGYNNALANPQVGVMNQNGYEMARNAALAGAYFNGVQEQPKVDDSKWLVKKDELDSMMQDENFANDMEKLRQVEFANANQDATVSEEWAKEYGAKAITGGYTEDEYYKLLENKYNLSKAQLQDITDTLQYYERENERQQAYQDFYNVANDMSNAKFKPFKKVGRALGTLGSYAGTAGYAIEGAWNAGMAALTGDPRTQSHLFDTTKNALRSGVSDSYKNSLGYDIVAGLGDLGVGLAMGNAPLVLAGNTAGEATTNAIARGADVNKAGFTGIGAGIADYAFNKVGLDAAKEKAMTKLTEAGVKKFLQANAIAGRTEAMENVLQDFTETVIDNILNGENSELRTTYANYKAQGNDDGDALFKTAIDYAKQLGMSGATGFAMGSAMQAIPSLTGGAVDYAMTPDENYRNKTFWGSVSKVIDRNNKLSPLEEKITDTNVKNNAANPLDNGVSAVDNGIKGEVQNGTERIDRTGNPTDIRPEQPRTVLSEVGGESTQSGVLGQGDSTRPNRTVVDDNTRKQMSEAGVKDVQLRDYSNDYKSYSDALSEARKANPHGAFVDPQSVEDLQKYNTKTFMSDNGGCGVAVKDNGNIVGVFKNAGKYANTDDAKGAAVDELLTARMNGGDRLDCYVVDNPTRNLVNMYAPAGFEPTHKVRYEKGINPEMDEWCRQDIDKQIKEGKIKDESEYKYPDIVFMKLRDGESIEDTLNLFKSNKVPDYDETLRNMPYTEAKDGKNAYEVAEAERDAMIGKQPTSEGAFFDGEKVTSEPVKAEGNPEEITSEPVNNQPTNPDKRLSNVYTKHLTKLKVVDMANSTSRINAEYDTHHAKDVIDTATKNYLENGDEWSDDVVSGKTRIDGDDDVAEATLCLMGLRDQITQAQESNADKSFIASLVSKRDALARKLRFAGTRLGEAVKAFDYFRGTAEGAVLNAQKMYDQMGKKWAKNKSNAKKVELNGKLAAAFNRLNNPETQSRERVQKSFDQIRTEVKNTIDANKASKMFTDSDIDYLAHMVENNLSVEELTSLLNTKMATGAFDIPQEAVERVNQLFDKAQQFGENSKQRVDLETQAFWELANANGQKSSVADKFEAWRYLAMLGNPKTHFRNMIGNALFSGVTGISNNLAAMMEAGVDRSTKAKGARETKKLQKLNDRIATLENSDSTRVQKEIPRLTEKAEKLKESAESHSQGIDRTKSVLNLANAKDRALVKGSNQDSLDNAYRQLTGQKYNDNKSVRNAIKEQKEVFDTKTVNALNNLNNKALTAEDTAAMRFKYSTSLAGWLKANGFDASIFEDEKEYRQLRKDYEASKVKAEENKLSPLENKPVDTARMNELGKRVEKLEQAREYAIKQAEYAAFHEDNAAADFLSKISRDANSSEYGVVRGMGKMLEGVLPFKKTPLNILFSGFRDYSPIGLVRGFTKLAQSKSGKAEVSEALEALAQGITGSALVGIGALLYDKGLLTMSEDDDSKYQSALEGNQNFAIKFGPKDSKYTATIDFAVPSVMPLFLGAQLKKMWDANPENADKPFFEHLEAALENTKEHPLDAAGNVFVAGSRLLSPVAETSMLSGVNNTLESISEGNGIDALANLGLALGTGYLTQGIPTVTGQVARTIDPIRRSTYSSENTQLGRTFDKTLEKIQNKTPFWSMFNEPYLDAYGREQTNSPANTGNKVADYALNFLYQAVSPSYIQKVEQTPADINAWEVYNGLDNEGKPIRDDQVFASVAPLTINGERLSDKDNYNYTKANGETNLAIRNALVGQDWYNALSPLEQKELLKSVDTLTKNYGQYTVAPDSLNVGDELQNFLDASQSYDEKGFATKDLQSGVQAVLEDKEAQYNPYGLGKNRYKELKAEGEDLKKYEGFGEALDSSGLEDSKTTEEIWQGKSLDGAYFGRGAEGVQKYADYKQDIKDLEMSDTKKAKQAYVRSGKSGLETIQKQDNTALAAGYVDKDGSPNYESYSKVYSIMGNDSDTRKFKQFQTKMADSNITKEEDYIPKLEDMTGLTDAQRGKYAIAMSGKKMDDLGKRGTSAYNQYDYEGYYYYKLLETVADFDGDGHHDKDDRAILMKNWGWSPNSEEYKFYVDLFKSNTSKK